MLDWSTERSGRDIGVYWTGVYWTRGENIQFFRDFDKENYVVYELMNREWIKFYMYNTLLNEKKSIALYINELRIINVK